MQETSIIISGFGGQGTLFAGQLLTYAALDYDKHCTWIPSYGPEMRGGTAHCTVIISDEEIGSPLVRYPSAVIAMNLPSLDKYENKVKPGGFLIANSSLINRVITPEEFTALFIPGSEIAEELGNSRISNMVMLGALLQAMPVLPMEVLKAALESHMPERHKKFLPMNYEALDKGAQFAAEQLKQTA